MKFSLEKVISFTLAFGDVQETLHLAKASAAGWGW